MGTLNKSMHRIESYYRIGCDTHLSPPLLLHTTTCSGPNRFSRLLLRPPPKHPIPKTLITETQHSDSDVSIPTPLDTSKPIYRTRSCITYFHDMTVLHISIF